ncbi:uncharacterized protein METZ01_LOCUS417700 [marine metagenome]|uniref:Uncharacterized protein n=1 Tax=marine metagenome TaxID=408172 RepID=A0A382X0U9_9ZZZZ
MIHLNNHNIDSVNLVILSFLSIFTLLLKHKALTV